MKVTWLLAILLIPRIGLAQDAIDLHSAVMHGPINPADLPVSGPIQRIEVRRTGPYRGDGFVFYSAAADAWPDVWAQGLGNGGGAMQFTSWLCVRLTQIHCGGFVQHWRGARGTGAPWLVTTPDGRTNYAANWAYDTGRWGDMVSYQPRAGDTVWAFLVAGNARAGQAYEFITQARTNVVALVYPSEDNGTFDFSSQPSPPTAVTPPPSVPTGSYDQSVLDWLRRMDEWARSNALDQARRDQAIQEAVKQVYDQNERIYADETAQHQAAQAIGAGGVNYTKLFKFLGTYVAPAVAALFAGVQMAK